MKKTILIIAVLFLTININSQIEFRAKAGGGFNNSFRISFGSFNSTWLSFSPLLNYQAGISSSISLNPKWKIAYDILYINKPSKVNFSGSIPSIDISFQYLSIPIYMQYKSNKNIVLDFGIGNNFLLDYNIGETTAIEKNNYNLGVLFGIEYKIFKKTYISLIFQTDIKPFAEELFEGEFSENVDYSYYHYNLMLSLSYQLFATKKK